MGVQFNLLPDVKLEFDRQQKSKKLVYTLSFISCAVVVCLVILSFFIVNVLQKKLLSDTANDIVKYNKQLKAIPDLDKVLTIQNQLKALPGLHESKHITSRFFFYLPQITPSNVYVGQVALDTKNNTITINGSANTLETVNTFIDTLKFTKFKENESDTVTKPVFTNVVLSTSSRSDKDAKYIITADYDPVLFDSTKTVNIIVPKEITTRSVTQSPDINSLLFNGQKLETKDQQGAQQ